MIDIVRRRDGEVKLPLGIFWQNRLPGVAGIQVVDLHDKGNRIISTRSERLAYIYVLDGELTLGGICGHVARAPSASHLQIRRSAPVCLGRTNRGKQTPKSGDRKCRCCESYKSSRFRIHKYF